jgi:hypothetical protein
MVPGLDTYRAANALIMQRSGDAVMVTSGVLSLAGCVRRVSSMFRPRDLLSPNRHSICHLNRRVIFKQNHSAGMAE